MKKPQLYYLYFVVLLRLQCRPNVVVQTRAAAPSPSPAPRLRSHMKTKSSRKTQDTARTALSLLALPHRTGRGAAFKGTVFAGSKGDFKGKHKFAWGLPI